MRLAQPPNEKIPLYLATLGPKSLEYTGQVAEGWMRHRVYARTRGNAARPYLAGAGSAKREKSRSTSTSAQPAACSEDIESLVAPLRMSKAFTLAAMGSEKTNFYNDAYAKSGWAEAAETVRDLWVKGHRDQAALGGTGRDGLTNQFTGHRRDGARSPKPLSQGSIARQSWSYHTCQLQIT